MKKALANAMAFMFVLGQLAACSTHKARINYKDFRDQGVALKSGNFSGEELGMVDGEDGGAIWDNCTEKARGSVEELIDNAKAKGANAVGSLKWSASESSDPRCKKSWGYFMLLPFVLTPLFMSTRVEGVAYKASKLGDNMIPLPTNEEEKEAFITALVGQ
ncbi:MAG: hypothetical protein AAF203_03945 [Pseudomonadota bacterium]